MTNHKLIWVAGVLACIIAGCASGLTSSESRKQAPELFYYVGGDGITVPSRQPFAQGVTVGQAINAADGFNEVADKSRVELLRDATEQRLTLDLVVGQSKAEDIELLPNDQLIVRAR